MVMMMVMMTVIMMTVMMITTIMVTMIMMMVMKMISYRDLGSSYWPGPAAMRAGVCPKPYLVSVHFYFYATIIQS